MADQTPLIAGLAGGLGAGALLLCGLAACIYYQHRRIKQDKKYYKNEGYIDANASIPVKATPPVNNVKTELDKASTNIDMNPETGQPLPMMFSLSGQEAGLTHHLPVVPPQLFQPTLAFNSGPRPGNQLYPIFEGYYPDPNAAGPSNNQPRFKRVAFNRSSSWVGPMDTMQQGQPQQVIFNPDPAGGRVNEAFYLRGSDDRGVLSDGEQYESRKKKQKKKDVKFIIEEKADKYSKKKRSRHHSKSSSSSSSSSSSGSESSEESSCSGSSDSSTNYDSTKRLRIVQRGAEPMYIVDPGRKGKKKRKKKDKKDKKDKKHQFFTLVPQVTPAPTVAVEPKLQAEPPPPPPAQPNSLQPIMFVLPGACQQQPQQQQQVPEYEVRPISYPAKPIPAGTTTFWSADDKKAPPQRTNQPVLFNAGAGGRQTTAYETQERSAQLGDDDDFGGQYQIGAVRGRVDKYFSNYSGGNGGGCSSCEASGGHGANFNGGSGGGGSGAVAVTYGRNGSGYEETTYSLNF